VPLTTITVPLTTITVGHTMKMWGVTLF
jgi:hypothetical protein